MPVAKIPNDHMSDSLQQIIGKLPERFKNKDEYLDVISWNLRWFNLKNPENVKNIAEVLTWLNADLFVFQEVQHGSLEVLAKTLRKNGAEPTR